MSFKVVEQTWNSDKDEKGYEYGWVCCYCKIPTTTIYIATSHDHTDTHVDLCTCGQGKSFQEVWPEITKGVFTYHPMEFYKRYFYNSPT